MSGLATIEREFNGAPVRFIDREDASLWMDAELRLGASNYSRLNGGGALVRPCTPTRKPKLGDLLSAVGSFGPSSVLATLSAMRYAARRARRSQGR